jgi:hypothetical protein
VRQRGEIGDPAYNQWENVQHTLFLADHSFQEERKNLLNLRPG